MRGSSRIASGLWMRAEEQMDTRSRPPGCGAGPLGRMRPLRDGRRMRPCASCRALSHQIARPPARQSQRLVLLWLLLLSVPSSTPDAPGFISVANFEEVAEVEGETGSVRAYTHTHIHTHTHTHTRRWCTANKYDISRAAVDAYVHACRRDPILLVGTVAAL